jgi:hypothetical protein
MAIRFERLHIFADVNRSKQSDRVSSRKQAQKLVELSYISLDSKGDKRAEAIAIEAYLADSLS